MQELFKNPVAYLSTSFVLLLMSFPLISFGTTEGSDFLLWLGFASLLLGAAIPPVQRLLFPPKENAG